MFRRVLLVPAILVALGACGGGGDGPTGPAAVTSITVSAPPQALSAIGETVTLTATGKNSKGNAIGDLTFTWTSSNPAVASVSNGQVTAVGNGSTTISAAVGSATGTVQVTVQQTATQVSVTFASDTIRAIGDTLRASATPRDARGNAIAGGTVTWLSTNPAVATVDGNGLMTAIAEGSAIVRGTSGTAQGERTIQVRQRASRLAFIRQPSAGRAGVVLTVQPQAELLDARGNRVTTDNSSVVTASVGSGGGTVVSGASVTANSGVVTFTNLAIGGSIGLKVLQLQATTTSAASSAAFQLSAGDPSTVVTASGNGQSGLAGSALPQPLVAGVRDAYGNPVTNVNVNFVVSQGTGTVNPAQGVTDGNGNASTVHTLSRYAGNSTVTAASSQVPSAQAQFTSIGTPNGVIRGTITNTGAPIITQSSVASARVARAVAPTARRRLTGLPSILPAPPRAGAKLARASAPLALDQSPVTPAPSSDPYVPGEFLVTYRPASIGAPAIGAQAYHQANVMAQVRTTIAEAVAPLVDEGSMQLLSVSPATLTARVRIDSSVTETQLVTKLRRDSRVQAVERNYIMRSHRVIPTAMQELFKAKGLGLRAPSYSLEAIMPSPFATAAFASVPMVDTYPGGGVYPGNARYTDQSWHYNIIGLPLAWTATTRSPNILIAVEDDGVRFDHPAMAGVYTNDGFDFVSLANMALCAGGSINLSGDGDGYDNNPTQPSNRDPNGNGTCLQGVKASGNHGLHVSGTIGAIRNNSSGVVGVNWQARIRPVRVLGVGGSGSNYDIAQGVLYAAGLPADNGLGGTVTAAGGAARVINMSLGGSSPSVVMANAVQQAFVAGSLIIASSGNNNNNTPNYPASFPEPVSVEAVAPSLAQASYSSFGNTVDVAAPGGDVQFGETFGVYSTTWNFQNNTPFVDSWQGTSMATPHVTGMAALLLAREPTLTAAQLKARIINYTIDLGAPGYDQFFGTGLVNMVNMIISSSVPPRTLFVRLVNASTGETVQTVTAGVGGTYGFTGLPDGAYWVFAGVDEFADGRFGVPMRPWGAFGNAAVPTNVVVDGAGLYSANFSLAMASELEANDTPENADELLPDGYQTGTFANTNDVDFFRLRVRASGSYVIEATGHVGACGWALEADPIITLYTASGTQLATNDDIDVGNKDYCARITGTLPVGDYLVRMSGYGAGRYVVSARKQQ